MLEPPSGKTPEPQNAARRGSKALGTLPPPWPERANCWLEGWPRPGSRKLIRDHRTGEVLYEDRGPLSEHRDRGDAKRRPR